ncbi:MAG: VWA domain-containing protein [Pseudomonadota bacterium]
MLNVSMFSKVKRNFRVARACRNGVSPRALSAFWKEEEGAATILTLFIFMFMLVMAGLGVDTMRHEMERAHLQATLDSAVLAGAGTPTQKTKNEVREIVQDYFEKSGMSQYLNEISDDDIESTINSTRIAASANMEIDTYLMKLSGVQTLSASAAATAEITIPKIEVSLVLDVSGSMKGAKIDEVQEGAKDFVTAIIGGADPGNSFISLIPFNANVTPSAGLYNALTVSEGHQRSTCLRFDQADFNTVKLNPNNSFDQQIFTSSHGNTFNNHNAGSLTSGGSAEFNRSCFTNDYVEILPYSMSVGDLHKAIEALQAAGYTSQNIGMKWATALLDPAFSSVVTELQKPVPSVDADGNAVMVSEVNPALKNIPASYADQETQKIIVLMSDGDNTRTHLFPMNSKFRGTGSDLYEIRPDDASDPADFEYFVYIEDDNDYYSVEDDEVIQTWQFNNLTNDMDVYVEGVDEIPEIGTAGGDIVVQRTWEQAWGFMSPILYEEITGDDSAEKQYWNNRIKGSKKDKWMKAICNEAKKNENLVVYTIGFEIAAGGNAEKVLKNCASGSNGVSGETNYYFPANRETIKKTFDAIASNVQNLRLTQ